MSKEPSERPPATWRIKIGFAIFVASIGWPVLVPVFPILGAPASVTVAFSGFMIVAAEFMMIAGAAVAGKEGFAFIKSRVLGFLRPDGLPHPVSRTRYTIGLLMFAAPLAFGLASPYFGHHLPAFDAHQWIYAVAFDLLLLISLFVLGGSFWEKLRSLLKHDAYAVFPVRPAGQVTSE